MRQNAEVHFGQVEQGESLRLPNNEQRPHLWLQMIKGSIKIDDSEIHTGDAASFLSSAQTIHALSDSEFILFQLS